MSVVESSQYSVAFLVEMRSNQLTTPASSSSAETMTAFPVISRYIVRVVSKPSNPK